ncbi:MULTISPECIES: DUF6416 domain-containing protein [Micromonospora]|uniref:Uncharacterized protein n=1 Tax=Micromonospora solifontis TaxID=2487138 RepID=A0ABX9WKW9_9ACTN|nr:MULTISPECIES: DUF6416 domain-containing protein [Micromonospora]NES14591.1 hypothetical protein [Micromonospora sp. PPF5-17B]NES35271.1 hypothetical protein [Micromonospora solifontis]RNM01053.1 hypothetical protein EFE23_03720 [Micromonospora solifontis]
MQEIKVLVPEERIPEFYEMFGRWLAGPPREVSDGPSDAVAWQDTDSDLELAKVVWAKFSQRAKDLFGVLIDSPEKTFSGEQLASDLDIPNGKYGVAGVLAWPGRYCAEVGRSLPFRFEDGPVGGSGNYSMTPELASLFGKARGSLRP